jgi:integrase
MSRRNAKGPRLWWCKPRHHKDGRFKQAGVWCIRDGKRYKESTGCGLDDRGGAERALEEYLARKRLLQTTTDGKRAPSQILLADVIALYADKKAKKNARPKEIKARLKQLLAFFGEKYLSDINGDLCRAYVEDRGSRGIARRELEDLRAAINFHRKEGHCDAVIDVVLPPEGAPRERWITRDEAAKMIRCAWRYREVQKGHPTGRYSRRHIARFIIWAIYSTRRKGALLSPSLGPATGLPWVDLDRGVLYGRSQPKEHKKRQPSVPVPPRLLNHLRRWHKNGQRNVIEWNGERVASIDKAYRATVEACELSDDVVIHSLRHSGITWLAIEGKEPYEICRYAGITMEVFEDVYAHHHPDYMDGIRAGFSKHREKRTKRKNDTFHDTFGETKREQGAMNVTNIDDYSREVG